MCKISKFCIVAIACIATMVAALGCEDIFGDFVETKSSDGLRVLTVENELCSFVMEYSAYYERVGPRGDLECNTPYMYLTLLAPEKRMQLLVPVNNDSLETVTSAYVPADIHVHVDQPSNSMWVTSTAKERLEQTIEGRERWEHFELLERSSVTVSGVEGELVAYVMDWFLPIPKEEGTLLQYYRAVYFDYGDLVWIIEAKSEMEMADQVQADFEHILETFQILE